MKMNRRWMMLILLILGAMIVSGCGKSEVMNSYNEAKEAFLTSASNLVLPVISIDGRAIGSGKPGEKSGLLRTLYIEWATNAAQSS